MFKLYQPTPHHHRLPLPHLSSPTHTHTDQRLDHDTVATTTTLFAALIMESPPPRPVSACLPHITRLGPFTSKEIALRSLRAAAAATLPEMYRAQFLDQKQILLACMCVCARAKAKVERGPSNFPELIIAKRREKEVWL